MISDLCVMLRKSDGSNSCLSDDDLGLDPIRFFEKDDRNNWVLKNWIMICVVQTAGLHDFSNMTTSTENIE